jgi:hypothetical protein
MTALGMSAATYRREYLDPALNALAADLSEQHFIDNDTEAVDCLRDIGMELARLGISPDLMAVFASCTEQLSHRNGSAIFHGRHLAGRHDRDHRVMRGRELNSKPSPSAAFAAVPLAAKLRPPLRVLTPHVIRHPELAAAFRDLLAIARTTDDAQLLSPAVAHELARSGPRTPRHKRVAALRTLLGAESKEAGAAQLATGDPQDRAGGRSHAQE